jgi:hypothetical protein
VQATASARGKGDAEVLPIVAYGQAIGDSERQVQVLNSDDLVRETIKSYSTVLHTV